MGQVPLYACAVASVLWESCPVTRSPSCGRLHRQTVQSLPPTCVISLLPRKRLVGRTMAPSQIQDLPPPLILRWQQVQKRQTNERSGLCHLGLHGSHFFCAQGCPKASKKNRKTQKVLAVSNGQIVQPQCWEVSGKSARTRWRRTETLANSIMYLFGQSFATTKKAPRTNANSI